MANGAPDVLRKMALPLIVVAPLLLGCAKAAAPRIRITYAPTGAGLSVSAVCLRGVCTTSPDAAAPRLAGFAVDDVNRRRECQPKRSAKLTIYDEDCAPLPIAGYNACLGESGDVVQIDAVVRSMRGSPPGFEEYGSDFVNLAGARRLTTQELVDAYKWAVGATTVKPRSTVLAMAKPMGPAVDEYCGAAHPPWALRVLSERATNDGSNVAREAYESVRDHAQGDFGEEVVDDIIVVHYPRSDTALAERTQEDVGLCLPPWERDCTRERSIVEPEKMSAVRTVGHIAWYAITQKFNDFLRTCVPGRTCWARQPLHIYLENPSGPKGETSPLVNYISINPALAKSDNRDLWSTIPHEIFHQIQYSYQDADGPAEPTIREGTAVWAEDLVVDPMNHYVATGTSFLQSASRAKLPYTWYEAGLFWKFFAEQYKGRATDAVVDLLGRTRTLGNRIEAIAAAADGAGGLDSVWSRFIITNYVHGVTAETTYRYDEEYDDVLWPDANGPLNQRRMHLRRCELTQQKLPFAVGMLAAWSGQYTLFGPGGTGDANLDISIQWMGHGPYPDVTQIIGTVSLTGDRKHAQMMHVDEVISMHDKRESQIARTLDEHHAVVLAITSSATDGHYQIFANAHCDSP